MSNKKYIATEGDGKDILHILESSASKGNIELLYTRRPDAYLSYMKETPDTHVFISHNKGRAVGTCTEIIRETYINGQASKSAYICGLKKDANYDGGLGFGMGFIRSLQRDDIDFYYCSVISDNITAQKIFGKNGKAISMKPITEYRTYILNPKIKIKSPKHDFTFTNATEDDKTELLDFLNREGKKRDLFPVINSLEQFCGLTYNDFYLLKKSDKIVAAAALWNQTEYKQYIVKRYSLIMKIARIINPLLSFFKYIKLPKENSPLDFPMLSFFVCQNNDINLYRIFLNEIKNEIAKEYSMFIFGIPKNNFAAPLFNKLPSIHFDTKIYEIKFPWSKQCYKQIDTNNFHPECALL